MNFVMDRRLGAIVAGGLGLLAIAGSANAMTFPGYTDGYTNILSSSTPGHEGTLELIYGGSWSAVTGDSRSFTNGTLTATRVKDTVDGAGSAGGNILLEGGNAFDGGVTDQVWQDGFVAAEARARYASDDQNFGYRYDDGGSEVTEMLFNVPDNGVNPGISGVAGPIPAPGGEFRWLRSGSGRTQTSLASENDNGHDHMVTYKLTSTDENFNEGRAVWLLFFEDRGEDENSNWDFNDLVVEIAVIPAPAALVFGLAGLAGVGAMRRRRMVG